MAGSAWERSDEGPSGSEPSDSEPSDSEPSCMSDGGSGEMTDGSAESGENAAADKEHGGGDGDSGGGKEAVVNPEELRRQNIRALVSGARLSLQRQPLLPRLGLTVQQAAVVLRQPFKSPHPNAPAMSEALKRKLAARKAFVPWGGGKFVPLKLKVPPREVEPLLDVDASGGTAGLGAAAAAEHAVVLPPGVEPLIIWEPPAGAEGEAVRVDDMLTQFLRPHQREGVQFMFECVTGLRSFEGRGCILADDMGLGKTLQGISLLWTLLTARGHPLLGGDPIARRVIICCPTSLVGNWDSECQKWLKGQVRTLPLCESSRDEALASISQFLSPRNPYQVMIVSYETFRLHAQRFADQGTCDLLICDEAHRLKNDATLTNRALGGLACRRRVLLSGTPLQNRLDEFYAMVSFCNPGVLGSPAQFRRHFEAPILAGREPDASEGEVHVCQERTAELSALVNQFILRRTNTLLSQHLPPKVVTIVCCRMTALQRSLYCHFLESKAAAALFATQKAARVLSAITSLRKLLNHPKLIWDALHSNAKSDEGKGPSKEAEGFEGCASFFPEDWFQGGRARSGFKAGWEVLSGKFAVLAGMLELLRSCTRDRIVVVSNYTQTLDLVAQLCRDRSYPFVRLDGTTTIKKRNKLVKDFNDASQNQFAFLLSSKAGGCGLNLIGANRLVLFDPSWNPADDKQAAARVWRDGQQKKVYVYRFMAAGSIEEKVYQRQLSKEGLQQVVDSKAGGKSAGPNLMSMDELRDLFSYEPDALSSTFDSMCLERPPAAAGGPQGRGGGKQKKGRGKGAGGGGRGGAGGGPSSGHKRQRPSHQRRHQQQRRRRGGWSSGDGGSDGEEGEMEESEEEWESWPVAERSSGGACGDGSDGEIISPDSEEEEEEGETVAAARRHKESPVMPGQRKGGSPGEESEGWSSDGGSGGPADVGPVGVAPPCGTEQLEEQEQQRGQGPAQPFPPLQQQQQAHVERQPAAASVAAAGGDNARGQAVQPAGQQRVLAIPTTVMEREHITIHNQQVGKPGEEQLRLWGHHSSTATVPDQVLRQIGDEHVAFVFSLEVDGRMVEPEPPLVPLPKAAQQAQQARGARPQRHLPAPGSGGVGAAHGARFVDNSTAAEATAAASSVAALGAAAASHVLPVAKQLQRAALQPLQGQRRQQALEPLRPAAKENASTSVQAQADGLALPKQQQQQRRVVGCSAAAKQVPTLVAAVQRAMQGLSDDSDDDFK